MNQTKKPSKTPPKNRLIYLSLNYLKYRPRSVHEIRTYLLKKSTNQAKIAQTIDYLKGHNLLNDLDFANWVTNSRINYKLKGHYYVSLELKRFGVSQEIIDRALDASGSTKEIESATKALEKQARKFTNPPRYLGRQKASKYLFSRGFSPTARKKAIDDFFQKE